MRRNSPDYNTHSFISSNKVWLRTDDLIIMMNYLKALNPNAAEKTSEGNGLVRAPLAKAGRFIANESKKNLRRAMKNPKGVTGNLLSAYVVKVKRNSTGVLVGFNHKGHHAHLVDLGHEVVSGNGKVRTGKRTKATLFHSSLRERQGQIGAIFIAEYERQLLKHTQYWDSQGRTDIGNKFR